MVSNTSIVNLAATKFWHERQLNWGPVHQYSDTDPDTRSFGAFHYSSSRREQAMWRHGELDYGVNCILSLVFGYRRLNNSSYMYRLINTSGFGASISTVGQIKWFSCVFWRNDLTEVQLSSINVVWFMVWPIQSITCPGTGNISRGQFSGRVSNLRLQL